MGARVEAGSPVRKYCNDPSSLVGSGTVAALEVVRNGQMIGFEGEPTGFL